MRRFFDFTSSMSHFLGIGIHGKQKGKWWHSYLIMPLWKVGRAYHRRKKHLLYRFHPAYRFHIIDTGLQPGPHDGGKLILHSTFSILMNSVKFRYGNLEQLELHAHNLKAAPIGNNPPELIDNELTFTRELIELVRWWTITRPADQSTARSLSDLVYKDCHFFTSINEETGAKSLEFSPIAPEHVDHESELNDLRSKITQDETAMLHRLINVKGWLD
jgi:hypothetical protein